MSHWISECLFMTNKAILELRWNIIAILNETSSVWLFTGLVSWSEERKFWISILWLLSCKVAWPDKSRQLDASLILFRISFQKFTQSCRYPIKLRARMHKADSLFVVMSNRMAKEPGACPETRVQATNSSEQNWTKQNNSDNNEMMKHFA